MGEFIYDEDEFQPVFSEQVAEFSDLGSADAISGLLEGEKVRAKVQQVGSLAALPDRYQVFVDARQAHRARWILRDSDLTDGELAYLATGQLGDKSED